MIFSALLVSHIVCAQETKLSKSIDRSFSVSEGLNVEITNKYGNVLIDTWNLNEIALKIEILAFGKDESSAEMLMDRVEFDFKHTDNYFEVETIFDRKQSFFRDLVNAVGDYSATLTSKQKLQINYELTIPQSVALVSISNKYGDVYLDDVEGNVNLIIAHGDLRMNKLEEFSRVSVNYGKAKIKSISKAHISLKGGELEVDFAANLGLTSSSSSITIQEALVVDMESTNDRIDIRSVRELSGSANFTEISILYLGVLCKMNQSYGSMSVRNLSDSFRTVRLYGKSTDYIFTISNKANFEGQIYARDDKLTIRDFPGERSKRFMDDKSKFVEVNGFFGRKESESTMKIEAQNGEVFIDFLDIKADAYNK